MNAIEAGSLVDRLTEEIDFGYAIEAGSLPNSRSNAIEAGSLSTRLIEEVNFDDAIEAGSLSTGSLKRSTPNDDAGCLDSTAPRAPSFLYGLGRLAHFRMA